MAIKQPWAVLVCRFSDDADPANVLVKNLPGLDPSAANDTGTVLNLFEQFFTSAGNGTFNAVRYFNEMSHGTIDLNDSKVFVVNVNYTKAQSDALGVNPGGQAYQAMLTTAAQKAALQQGVPLQNFYGLVITSHYPLATAQGGGIQGGALVPGPVGWVGMDYRWVRNNGTSSWGHEMGHGFGLDHSRVDGGSDDYKDPWDIMSARATYIAPDPDYGATGPGLNAWNMRSHGWLDESRVWHCPSGPFTKTLQLRPLHRIDLPGLLAAELPPMNDTAGFPRYLVEYRKKENWDAAFPRSCILIHRFEGPMYQFMGTHSYAMPGNGGLSDLVTGDGFGNGSFGPQLLVVNIDDNSDMATIVLSMRPYPVWRLPIYNPWWWIETHGGLVPPGPPPPWDVNSIVAVSAILQTANWVAPELRSSVLQIALKQVAILSTEIKNQIKPDSK